MSEALGIAEAFVSPVGDPEKPLGLLFRRSLLEVEHIGHLVLFRGWLHALANRRHVLGDVEAEVVYVEVDVPLLEVRRRRRPGTRILLAPPLRSCS